MALILTSGPALEPVTLAEGKAHLRVDGNAEDPLITSLIMTSRMHVETALGLALISQSWSYFIDAWPRAGTVTLPLRPVQSIAALRVYAADGSYTVVGSDAYQLDGASLTPRVVRRQPAIWTTPGRPANGVEIAFTAGYGPAATDVPAPIRHAVLLLLAHWYENREIVEIGSPAMVIPSTVSDLLGPYRPVRL